MKLNTSCILILTFLTAAVIGYGGGEEPDDEDYGYGRHHCGSHRHHHHGHHHHGHHHHGHHHHGHHGHYHNGERDKCSRYNSLDPGRTASKAPPPNLDTAKRIWSQDAAPSAGINVPTGARPFRKEIKLGDCVDRVTIDIGADDYNTLYVNGKLVGSGTNWQQGKRYSVRLNATQDIVIGVWAANGPTQAWLAVAGVAWNSHNANPNTTSFITDASWKTQSKSIPDAGFLASLAPGYNDQGWEQAYVRPQNYLGVKNPTVESPWNDRFTNVYPGVQDAPAAPRADVL